MNDHARLSPGICPKKAGFSETSMGPPGVWSGGTNAARVSIFRSLREPGMAMHKMEGWERGK